MALNKPAARATKPTALASASPAAVAAAVDNVITSITLSRGLTISMGEFNSVKVQATVSGNDYDTVSAKVEELLALEAEKAGAQFHSIVGGEGDDDTTTEGEAEGEEDSADAGEGAEEEGTLGPDDINAMKRPELVALIAEHGLEIDADDHPKNAKGLTTLRNAIIEAAFGDEEAAAEGGEEAAGEEEEITEEAINAMDRPALVKFIKANEIDVDPSKITKLVALKTAVIEALTAASDEDGEATGDDDGTGEDAGDDAGYTEEDLKASTIDDLKAVYVEWDMGAFPKGPPIKAKAAAIKAILAAQSGE